MHTEMLLFITDPTSAGTNSHKDTLVKTLTLAPRMNDLEDDSWSREESDETRKRKSVWV